MAEYSHFQIFLFFVFLLSLSAGLTCLVKRLRIIDKPNHRSSHVQPVPRSGGAAIIVTTYLGMGLLLWLHDFSQTALQQLVGVGIASGVLAFAGLLDDLGRLYTFRSKLALQVLGCVILFPFGLVIENLPVPGLGQISLGWIGYPVTFLWVLGLTNIFNFMDGLDGIASGTALIVASVLLLLPGGGVLDLAECVAFVLFSSTLGFFFFNFPRAKIFLGDVGSQFLGFVFASVAIMAAGDDASGLPVLIIPLLFFHFIFDTVFTFFRRLIAGENVAEAHRSHLYQLMNQCGLSHVQVSLFYFIVTFGQGVGAYVLLQLPVTHQWAVFLPFLALQVLFAITILISARRRGVV